MRHILSVMVENNPGVLRRVAGLFGRRGYNIDSLVVSATEDEKISRMTIAVTGEDQIIDQVMKQLRKLEEVISVDDLSKTERVVKQLLLVKVRANLETRVHIITLMDVFKARIVNIGKENLIVEATGASSKIEAIIETLKPFGILELAKTGAIAMAREDGDEFEGDND